MWLVNTHTLASAGSDEAAVRNAQFTQIRDYVAANTDSRHPMLYLGDFNVIEESPEWVSMMSALGLPTPNADLFMNTHPIGSPVARFTADATRNAYTYYWGGESLTVRERLDYILVRQGTDYQIEVDCIEITDDPIFTSLCAFEGWLAAPLVSPAMICYISDHFGVEAGLRLVTPNHVR